MASSSSSNPAVDDHHLLVDEFYFSALFDSDEILPISDEKYAVELHLQEALMSSAIYARVKREMKEETGHVVAGEVKQEIGGSSREPATLKPIKKEPGDDEQEMKMMMELAKEKKWRRCPNCKFYVEKSEGCLHISCRCGFQFCYGCGVPWASSHACGEV